MFVVKNLDFASNNNEKDMQSILNMLSQISKVEQLNPNEWQNILGMITNYPYISYIITDATNNDNIVGFAKIFKERKISHHGLHTWHLEDVVVDKTHQNKGLGKLLLENIKLNFMNDNDAYAIKLISAKNVIGFYKRIGFSLGAEEENIEMKIVK